MSEPKLKRFNVTKRFEILVETEISAPNLETAAVEAGKLDATSFVKFKNTLIDFTTLEGTSVSEKY